MYERLGALTPASVRTEVFGWMSSGAMAGAAIGSTLAGTVVEAFGVPWVFAAAALLTLVAALILIQVPPHLPEEYPDDYPTSRDRLPVDSGRPAAGGGELGDPVEQPVGK